MPLYEFTCDGCQAEREVILPFSEAGKNQECGCGEQMRQRFSLSTFTMPQTGRDKVFGTLNQEEGAMTFPGGDKHRARYEQAMVKGVDGSQRTSQYGQFRPVNGSRA